MLRQLDIQSFRVVESITFKPGPALSAITGETGAGKSLLIGALEAALGGEVNRDDVRAPAEMAAVVAVFDIDPTSPAHKNLKALLPKWNGPRLVLERRIHVSGRSSCRIHGRQSSRELLQEIGAWLVDFHGQHSHQLLLSTRAQLDILDAFGDLISVRESMTEHYRRWQNLKRLLSEARERYDRLTAEKEERAFQLSELKGSDLRAGEKEELEKKLKILSTAQHWKSVCAMARNALVDDDGAVVERLAAIKRELSPLGAHFSDLVSGLSELDASIVALQEFAEVVRQIDGKLRLDPERQQEIDDRLSIIIGLEKRYGRQEEGLIAFRDELEHQVLSVAEARDELRELEGELDASRDELESKAAELTTGRTRAAEQLAPRVENELRLLGLGQSRLVVRLESLPFRDGFAGDIRGKEHAHLLFSSALEEDPKELSRVASGGELSRIMLALKTVLGGTDPVDSMVFDEIDTGVGGGLAAVVGDHLHELSSDRQVICITHLPAVASMATDHFLVEREASNRVSIIISKIAGDSRTKEIARMLGGFPLTNEAVQHAEMLLNPRKRGG